MAKIPMARNADGLAGEIFAAFLAASKQNDIVTAQQLWRIWIKLPPPADNALESAAHRTAARPSK